MFQRFYNANKDLINKIIFLTVFFLIIYIFVNFLFYYIAPFVFGYVLSLLLIPFVDYFDNRFKIHRGVSSAVFIVIVIFLLIILGTGIVTKIIDEIKSLSSNWDIYMQQLTRIVNNLNQNYDELLTFIPHQLSSVAETALTALVAGLTSALSSGVKQGSLNLVVSVPSFLLSTLLCIISLFFFTKDRKIIHKAIKNISPVWLSDSYRTIKNALINAVLGYVKAQLILMTVTATICVIGLAVIRFPYSLLIGLGASFIDALPVFGVGFVLWPLAFVSFISGSYSTALSIMIIYVIVILVRQFLEPKVLGSQIGLHPLLTLMSIYVGLKVFGVLGFIIGPMILVVIKVILESNNTQKSNTDIIRDDSLV